MVLLSILFNILFNYKVSLNFRKYSFLDLMNFRLDFFLFSKDSRCAIFITDLFFSTKKSPLRSTGVKCKALVFYSVLISGRRDEGRSRPRLHELSILLLLLIYIIAVIHNIRFCKDTLCKVLGKT